MTPQQFLASQQAQDAVFNGQFGNYANKYGPEGAAKAWFAGERGMKNPNARDQLGTTVAGYANKFNAGLQQPMPQGSQPPAQLAQAASPPQAPNRAQVAVPPAIMDLYKKYGSNPRTEAKAMQVLAPYLKPTDRYEPVTDDKGNVTGQRSALTGEKKGDPTRPEYLYTKQDDGSIVAQNKNDPNDVRFIEPPGGSKRQADFHGEKAHATTAGEQRAKQDAARPEQEAQGRKVADIVVQDIDRAIKEVDSATLPTTGAIGPWVATIGGTAAHNVRALVDTVKANAGFAELQKMRNNSPTGGALGNVSEREIAFLQATIGNLEQSQGEAQFKDNLRRIKNAYTDIIHGAGKGPEREKLTFQSPPASGGVDPAALEEARRRGLMK